MTVFSIWYSAKLEKERQARKLSLSPTEIDHLLNLLRDAQREGSYYGRKDHYYKRTERLIARLQEL